MPQDPSVAPVNAADLRNRLRGPTSETSSESAAVLEMETAEVESTPPNRPNVATARPPRAKSGSSSDQRSPRGTDPTTRTPLPKEISLHAVTADEVIHLRNENAELRRLVEQAIAQEEDFSHQLNEASDRESELHSQVESLGHEIQDLNEKVGRLKAGAGDAGDLIIKLHEREDDVKLLTDQVQHLEAQLRAAQDGSGIDQYIQAIQERDRAIEALNARIVELEQLIADVPPPPPTDEELAKLADELERERCKVMQLRKELDDDKRTHAEDIEDFERQMREMEVQMSKERAEMARQRSELQRMQSEVRSELEAVQRGDGALRDRLAQIHRKPSEPEQSPSAAPGAPSSAATKREKESGIMQRLFGKK